MKIFLNGRKTGIEGGRTTVHIIIIIIIILIIPIIVVNVYVRPRCWAVGPYSVQQLSTIHNKKPNIYKLHIIIRGRV